MTAPDPGLTDLIAAHTLRVVELNEAVRYPECNGCDWVGGLVKDHAKHLALVVEQHTNRRTAELDHASCCNDGIEDSTGTAYICRGECNEAEQIAQAERIAELEAEIVRRQEAAEIIGALHAKVCNDVAKAVGIEVDPNGDADWAGIFELLAELGDRANATEAAVRRVRDVLTIGPLHRLDFPKYKDPYAIDRHVVAAAIDGVQPDRAALEGEQR